MEEEKYLIIFEIYCFSYHFRQYLSGFQNDYHSLNQSINQGTGRIMKPIDYPTGSFSRFAFLLNMIVFRKFLIDVPVCMSIERVGCNCCN